MSETKIIRGGTVVTVEGELKADMHVVGEKIAAVGADLDLAPLAPTSGRHRPRSDLAPTSTSR